MQVRKRLIEDNSAVSPVIGVILMVAITVILAAVIASFVLGMGPNTTSTPTATFSSEFTDGTPNYVTITMDSGETLEAGDLSIQGPGVASDYNKSLSHTNYLSSPDSEITAGTSFKVNLKSGSTTDYQINLIYTDGDTTSTMRTFEN